MNGVFFAKRFALFEVKEVLFAESLKLRCLFQGSLKIAQTLVGTLNTSSRLMHHLCSFKNGIFLQLGNRRKLLLA